MKLTVFAATIAFLMWGAPAFAGMAPDDDADGVPNPDDNCRVDANPDQDDTDGDDCGNLCDADYDNNGTVAIGDFGAFSAAFAGNDEEKVHFEPVPGGTVSIGDFGFFSANFGGNPGPSGISTGTTECPI